MNLNDLKIETDYGKKGLDDNSVESGDVSVYFRNLENRLIQNILAADVVVGCVAWLTHPRILDALSQVRHGVSIIVQKEDFLRPDINAGNTWKDNLRKQYTAIKPKFDRHGFPGLVSQLSMCGDPTLQCIRCVGNHNSAKAPAFPRMHNKFLVFCELIKEDDETGRAEFTPQKVWTGSFNFTKNAGDSLENAVLLRNPRIAKAYYDEWSQITALSEPLDWESSWCVPEWRVGT